MIEKIKSLRSGPTLNLFNPYAKYFYKLDSINLIIGNNGKGKTTLIKDIIRDLTDIGSPIEYIADGISENLGIIYYTATPFHTGLKLRGRSYVHFVDASKPQDERQSFINSSKEYLEICKLLGLDHSLKSIQQFDLTEISFELAKTLISGFPSRQRPLPSELIHLEKLCSRHRTLNQQYKRINADVLSLGRIGRTKNNNDADFNHEFQRVSYILEDTAKEIIAIKRKIADEFLDRYGPRDPDIFADWIAGATLLRERQPVGFQRDLAWYFFDRLWDSNRMPNHGGRFYARRDKIIEFLGAIGSKDCGFVQFEDNQLKVHVDTARLIISGLPNEMIEDASAFGLIRIGFDEMSSGQAAIMHQMINISHSIRELISKGKKEVLLFIDEGDLLLHLNWQREYISLLDKRLGNFKSGQNKLDSLQVVIATHSPMLASDILRDSITTLDDDRRLPSFGAPIQRIINLSFGTPSIGLIAQQAIKELDGKTELSEADLEMLGQIDDEFIRRHIKDKANK